MRRTVLAVAMMAAGCGGEPDRGTPPMAVVGDEIADSVRAEVELVNREIANPVRCDLIAAAAYGWYCNGDPCSEPGPAPDGGVVAHPACSPWSDANIFSLDFDVVGHECPATIAQIADASAECMRHSISDATTDCALRAQSSEDFMCCFKGTSAMRFAGPCD
jgi:hypothetical protein